MILTQQDKVHMGLGRTDGKGMTAYEFRTIRNTLGLTRGGFAELIGCDLPLVRTYENETSDDGDKILARHAEHVRHIAQMPARKRKRFIKISGCAMQRSNKFK